MLLLLKNLRTYRSQQDRLPIKTGINMLDRKEITEWAIRKYGVKIRRLIKTVTRGVADSEGRKNVMNRFRDIGVEDVPGALYETWTEVKGSKYVVYYKQNRARKKFLKGFLKGGHRFIKFIALLMVFWVLFVTGPDKTFGVSVFAFLFIIWFLEDILLMFLSFRKSKKKYLEGLDPPEEAASGKNGRLNFTYVFGTLLFLFSILSILFLIPPLSTPWDIKTTHGKYSWAIIYIFVIILWLVATNAMVSAFKHSHSLGRRLALLSHDKRIMKRLNREEHLNKYGRALTKYVYLPVLLSAIFVGVSIGFKYIYAILMEGLKSEDFSIMDSLGTGLMNLISGEKTAELPEWLPRINGVWLLLFQLVCLILLCVGAYMRNRKINSVLWPNTPQSPSGKKVCLLVEDLEFIKEKGEGGGDDDDNQIKNSDELFDENMIL